MVQFPFLLILSITVFDFLIAFCIRIIMKIMKIMRK